MLNAFPRYLYFEKGNIFTGDHQGMRFRLCMDKNDEGARLLAWVWPEPLCFASTPEEQRTQADFEMTEAGHESACNWVRQQYETRIEEWNKHYAKPKE